jgi:polyhydroxyalkanoate synthesis regulator phasin
MAEFDLFRNAIDAGVAFTQTTRQRAEEVVKDLVRTGEVSREQAVQHVEEFVGRSRKNTESVVSMVRHLDERLGTAATRDELAKLASRVSVTLPFSSGRRLLRSDASATGPGRGTSRPTGGPSPSTGSTPAHVTPSPGDSAGSGATAGSTSTAKRAPSRPRKTTSNGSGAPAARAARPKPALPTPATADAPASPSVADSAPKTAPKTTTKAVAKAASGPKSATSAASKSTAGVKRATPVKRAAKKA